MDIEVEVITSAVVMEVDANTVCVEASQLGWRPGFFPMTIAATIGNAQPFDRMSVNEDCVKYRQRGESFLTLIVLND